MEKVRCAGHIPDAPAMTTRHDKGMFQGEHPVEKKSVVAYKGLTPVAWCTEEERCGVQRVDGRTPVGCMGEGTGSSAGAPEAGGSADGHITRINKRKELLSKFF